MEVMISQLPGWLKATHNMFWVSGTAPAQYGWPVTRQSNHNLLGMIIQKSPIQARVDEAQRLLARSGAPIPASAEQRKSFNERCDAEAFAAEAFNAIKTRAPLTRKDYGS